MGSHRRYGRRDSLAAAAFIVDRQEERETLCERSEAEDLAADGLVGFDPECRFARDGFELGLHACTRRDGRLIQPGEAGQCFAEQRQQVREQGKGLFPEPLPYPEVQA